jgi:hypothetical protein
VTEIADNAFLKRRVDFQILFPEKPDVPKIPYSDIIGTSGQHIFSTQWQSGKVWSPVFYRGSPGKKGGL